jgi:hypothetical protein
MVLLEERLDLRGGHGSKTLTRALTCVY